MSPNPVTFGFCLHNATNVTHILKEKSSFQIIQFIELKIFD